MSGEEVSFSHSKMGFEIRAYCKTFSYAANAFVWSLINSLTLPETEIRKGNKAKSKRE
jgi:hypothetical protein